MLKSGLSINRREIEVEIFVFFCVGRQVPDGRNSRYIYCLLVCLSYDRNSGSEAQEAQIDLIRILKDSATHALPAPRNNWRLLGSRAIKRQMRPKTKELLKAECPSTASNPRRVRWLTPGTTGGGERTDAQFSHTGALINLGSGLSPRFQQRLERRKRFDPTWLVAI
ncbi:hypothetical protein ACO22_01694 [Paracoccidioides brasiliensis]|uniref:Uncharacterized protein n=1 Tax=Paracoccidioides brasiliensis TaxID=121759 RepID=A0A1D2JKV7_PARBR|nr:hypothetical protein ACO22_01694 [Paracoccidioides brasiliensis]